MTANAKNKKRNTEQIVSQDGLDRLQKSLSQYVDKENNKNDFTKDASKETKENKENNDLSEKVIDNANKFFLLKILSPEITRNEEKRREHKDQLMNIVKKFLIFQFAILSVLLIGIIVTIFVFHGLKNDIDIKYLKTIIKFVSVYISSVVVEIIAMLHSIVKNVFDTSITGLVELYKDANNTDEKNK